MPRLLLVLRFYRSSMLFFGAGVSLSLAWLAGRYGAPIVPWLLVGKIVLLPLVLYLYVVPRYADEFYYYLNLGVRRRWLLGGSCALDFVLCWLLLNIVLWIAG